VTGYSFSTDTSVALIIAKTVSPSLRFIRFTEPVVMIDVTVPAAVRMAISDTTLSETIFSIVPGKRFRMLVLMVVRRMLLSHNFDRHHHAFVLVFHDVAVKHETAATSRKLDHCLRTPLAVKLPEQYQRHRDLFSELQWLKFTVG
jgi:hypothetical protein